MPTFTLQAERRNLTVKPRSIRNSGKIPAVSYGDGKEVMHLSLDYQGFRKVFAKAGESTVIELDIEGHKAPVLIHEVQYDPVSDHISHVDFYLVDMTKEVTTKISVKCVGLAPAVKNLGGILTVHKHEITIRCLPKDLVPVIEVDVTSLENFHSSIHLKDLKFPPTLKILDSLEDTIVNVRPPKIEEEEVKPVEAAAAVPGVEGAPGAAVGAAEAAAAGETTAKTPAEKKSEKK